jgi:thioesterase domain-containing protein/acyl carrier protein
MVPAAFVTLSAMPLTPNGKIDRAALPEPNVSIARSSSPNPRNEIERKLLEIWKELLGTDAVGVNDSFFELGGHSLLAVRMVERIRQAFRQNLPLAKLFTAPTVAELALALGTGDGALSDDVLVPLRAAGEWAPLFCVPGIANDAFTFEPLSRRLDKRQPIYVLLLQGLTSRGGVPTRVEEMAVAFIRHLREVQPDGPYRLGGYSFGGLIAHEIAAQLEEAGQQVELLAQFDGFAPSAARQKPLYQRLWLHARRAIEQGPHAAIQHYRDNVGPKNFAASGDRAAQLEATIRSACDIARMKHQSRRICARITLFKATVREDWREFLVHAPDNGWGELGGGLDIRDVDGGHLNLLQDQHVDRLGAKLNNCLHALENRRYKQACDSSAAQSFA